MNNYVETQNKLIDTAQSVYGNDKMKVDAVVYNGKEFIIFINTHASSYAQQILYISPGSKGFDDLKELIV